MILRLIWNKDLQEYICKLLTLSYYEYQKDMSNML